MKLLNIKNLNLTTILFMLCCLHNCFESPDKDMREISIQNNCGESIYIFEARTNYNMGVSDILMDNRLTTRKVLNGESYVTEIFEKDSDFELKYYKWDYYVYNFLILKESTYDKYSLDDIMRLNISDAMYSLKYLDFEEINFWITYTGSKDSE